MDKSNIEKNSEYMELVDAVHNLWCSVKITRDRLRPFMYPDLGSKEVEPIGIQTESNFFNFLILLHDDLSTIHDHLQVTYDSVAFKDIAHKEAPTEGLPVPYEDTIVDRITQISNVISSITKLTANLANKVEYIIPNAESYSDDVDAQCASPIEPNTSPCTIAIRAIRMNIQEISYKLSSLVPDLVINNL